MVGVDRFVVDRTYRRVGGGAVILGGSPRRLFRLTAAGRRVADALERGERPPANHHPLTDRLVAAGAIHPAPDASPFGPADVTVVIPVHGRCPDLAPYLEGGLAGGLAGIVVVDDASADPVTVPDGVRLIRRPVNGGPGAARQTGLAVVHSPLVAFVDADVRAPDESSTPEWLTPLLAHFADERVGLVAPRVCSDPGVEGVIAAYERHRSPLDLGPHPDRIVPGGRVAYVPAAAVVARTVALRQIGGFDPAMRVGEDVDLVWRLVEAGWACRYEPAATVNHRPRSTWTALLAQRAGYGRSAGPLAVNHPGALTPLRLSGWTAAAWALVVARRPALATAFLGLTGLGLARRLPGVECPEIARLTVGGHLAGGAGAATAVRRVWWPLAAVAAAAVPRTRPWLAATLAPLVAEWWRSDRTVPLATWTALALLDDAAYGAGVWRGALDRRTLAPLLPAWSRPPRDPSRRGAGRPVDGRRRRRAATASGYGSGR